MTDQDAHRLLDPAFHEGVVELEEDGEVIFAAEQKIAPGFKMPESAGEMSEPIPLVTKVTVNSFARRGDDLPGFAGVKADLALDALKFGWDFVKDNKPQSTAEGASSAILAAEDMAWNHYAAAKPFASKAFTYRFTNAIGVQCVYARYKIRGSYDAQYDGTIDTVKAGHYMPSVEVYPESVDVAWTWTLNAGVQLSRISNAGPIGGTLDPWLTINIWLTRSTMVTTRTDNYTFGLQGSKGYLGKV